MEKAGVEKKIEKKNMLAPSSVKDISINFLWSPEQFEWSCLKFQ